MKALTARCVARGVDALDLDGADLDDVAAVVETEVIRSDASRALDPRSLESVHVHRNVDRLQQGSDALDAMTHHRTTDVVGVIVGGEHSSDRHPIGCGDVQKFSDTVGRIDDDAFPGRAIADQIDEVDHLTGHRVGRGEIVSGQELAKVEDVGHRLYANPVSFERLTRLDVGQRIPFGGDRVATVSADLAASFLPGDRLVVVQSTGDLLHVPRSVGDIVDQAVTEAQSAFRAFGKVVTSAVDRFYEEFATRLENDEIFGVVSAANDSDVKDARVRGRATGRLVLSDSMRRDMIVALRMWRDLEDPFGGSTDTIHHASWSVEQRRSSLGVIGFVFEGRPNVFADATGVLKSGNTVVFRIGSDALRTARSLMDVCVKPALKASGLPSGSVVLVDSPDRAAGHALFSDSRLALAVARGSGEAVAQLGAVARQAGIPVSLHGTGGAWMHVASDMEASRVAAIVEASLDRKVCNTVNVITIGGDDGDLLRAVLNGVQSAASRRGVRPVIHTTLADRPAMLDQIGHEADVRGHVDQTFLGTEWEWDDVPEVSVIRVRDLDETLELFDLYSPRFILSVLSDDHEMLEDAYRSSEAPFVGNGFTRWVDGQYALGRPELGLSNWQDGRLFARGGILSGDGVFSVRYVARHNDAQQRR